MCKHCEEMQFCWGGGVDMFLCFYCIFCISTCLASKIVFSVNFVIWTTNFSFMQSHWGICRLTLSMAQKVFLTDLLKTLSQRSWQQKMTAQRQTASQPSSLLHRSSLTTSQWETGAMKDFQLFHLFIWQLVVRQIRIGIIESYILCISVQSFAFNGNVFCLYTCTCGTA